MGSGSKLHSELYPNRVIALIAGQLRFKCFNLGRLSRLPLELDLSHQLLV